MALGACDMGVPVRQENSELSIIWVFHWTFSPTNVEASGSKIRFAITLADLPGDAYGREIGSYGGENPTLLVPGYRHTL